MTITKYSKNDVLTKNNFRKFQCFVGSSKFYKNNLFSPEMKKKSSENCVNPDKIVTDEYNIDSLQLLTFYPEERKRYHKNNIRKVDVESLLVAIKNIFGYKVEMIRKDLLMIRSIYAFTEDDVFWIRLKEDGNGSFKLKLEHTSYVDEWREEYERYIIGRRSLSAFLCAVSLKLFETKTFD